MEERAIILLVKLIIIFLFQFIPLADASSSMQTNDDSIKSLLSTVEQSSIPVDHTIANAKTSGGFSEFNFSDVSVVKTVEPGFEGPRITITIKAPKVEEIHNEIVISLDTSGSFGKGGRSDYGVILREVMPQVLKYIEDKDPSCRISLMSWDDNIDFVYGPWNNSNISRVELVPIKRARSEILRKNIFDPPDHELILPFLNISLNLSVLKSYLPSWTHTNADDETYIYFWENESSDLNLGVRGAIEILNGSDRKEKISKNVLLITGNSEFIPLNETVGSEIQKNGYRFFVVGLGVPFNSQLDKTLTRISNDSGAKVGPYYTPGIAGWTEDSMRTVIDKAVQDIINNNRIISNISLNESLYPYINILSIIINKNGQTLKDPVYNKTNMNFTLPGGLNASEELEIIIDTKLNMSLPIDVSEKRSRVIYSIDHGIGPSLVTYYWQGRTKVIVELPEKSVT